VNLEFAVRYFPDADPKAYISLALVYKARGELRKAQGTLEKGRRIFPQDPALQQLRLRID